MTRFSLKLAGRLLLSVLLVLPYYAEPWQAAAQNALAQDTPPQPSPQNTPQQTPTQEMQQRAPSQDKLTSAQLDQLVAPIALYPDPLLAEILIASVYPLDVVEAERWLEKNKQLKGDARKAAVDKQDWDDSIKALTATPSVLEMMSKQLDWMQKLGDAVVNQQPDVMDSVQRLRARAQSTDKLKTTRQQTVRVDQVEGRSVIVVEPAVPDEMYVPYYNPAVVYGDWAYADYPPYYFEPPYYIGAGLLAAGLAFGAGYAIGNWGGWWGGGVNWSGGGNNIVINRPGGRPTHPIAGGGNRWQPRVDHRQALGNRGGQRVQRDFRGTNGRQVINPNNRAGSRNNVANRNNATNRAAAKNRATQGSRVSQGGAKNKAASNKGAAKSKVSQRAGGGKNATARNRTAARTANTSRGRQAATHMRGRGGTGGLGGYSRSAGMRARAGAVGMGGGGGFRAGGGGMRLGGGARGGGGRVGGGGRGRRSDIMLKHDIVLLSHLRNGLNVYRFTYNGSTKPYVGVIAQEVQQIWPDAVERGSDGYLRVHYEKLGIKFQSYEQWLASHDRVR